MRVLLVYHSNSAQKEAFQRFRCGEGAKRFHTNCRIEDGDTIYHFANIRELHDAQRYAGMQFQDLRIADKEKLTGHAHNYLKSLIRIA